MEIQLYRIQVTLLTFLLVGLVQGQIVTRDIPLIELDGYLATKEQKVGNVKPGNAAKVLWVSDHKYQKTPYAFVYLHGFGASHREGEPIMSKLSEAFGANVYMSRLEEHGLDRENGYEYLTPESHLASAENALAMGKLLGEKVVLVSTSTGGTLSLHLAAKDADIAGLIMYSPFIGLFNPMMEKIIEPGGKEFFVAQAGGEIQKQAREPEVAKYWSTNYHVNGYVSLISMLKQTMVSETFEKVKCPVFMGYYYKNEEEQDKVVSVAAMLEMFDQLGTPASDKLSMAFPNTANHVIGCDLRSRDWSSVYEETVTFINDVIQR